MSKKAHWVVGQDELGHSTLQWTVGAESLEQEAKSDALSDTYNFLRRLDIESLNLADDADADGAGYDPYNTGSFRTGRIRSPAKLRR
jgi:hypothetical protein